MDSIERYDRRVHTEEIESIREKVVKKEDNNDNELSEEPGSE